MSLSQLSEITLGQKLRLRRKRLGLTLQEVADAAGLSVGFVSQVERGISTPSLSSLINLASVLGVGVESFVRSPVTAGPISRSRQRPGYTTGLNAPTYERISDDFPGHRLNSVLMILPPHYAAEAIRHDGEELMYVVEGRIRCTVDGEARILETGDSVHFSSRRSHFTENLEDTPARVLWVGTLQIFAETGDPAHHNESSEEQGDSK